MQARAFREFLGYLSTSVGMALACSAYLMVSELHASASGYTYLVVLLAAAVCSVLALSIGELASMFPSAPGVRTYVRAGLGDAVSLFCTFGVLMVVLLFAGVECHALLLALRPWVDERFDLWVVSAVVLTITIVNLIGLELPQLLQVLFTIAIVGCLGSASLLLVIHSPAPSEAPPTMLNASLAVGGAIFLFTGFEWVTALGRSPKSYVARVPWSMPAALLVLGLMYSLLSAAFDRVDVGGTRANPAAQMAVAQLVWGAAGAKVMAGISVLSLFTTFNAGTMGASRLVYALARESKLPAWGKIVSTRSGSPIGAVAFVGLSVWVACLVILAGHFERAAMLACAALYCLVYCGFLLAAVRLRRKSPELKRSFRSPVPVAVQAVIGGALPFFGLAVLVSEPGQERAAVQLFVIVVAVLVAAVWRALPQRGADLSAAPAAAAEGKRGSA